MVQSVRSPHSPHGQKNIWCGPCGRRKRRSVVRAAAARPQCPGLVISGMNNDSIKDIQVDLLFYDAIKFCHNFHIDTKLFHYLPHILVFRATQQIITKNSFNMLKNNNLILSTQTQISYCSLSVTS